MSTGIDQLLAERGLSLRDFGLQFSRSIAALAVDPHGYFEKKYAARIERSTSNQEIAGVVVQLVQWATSSAVSEAQRMKLDRELTDQGLPGLADLRLLLLP